MGRRLALGVFWMGSGVFLGAFLGVALTESVTHKVLARERAALEAKHTAEMHVISCEIERFQWKKKK